MSAPDGPRNAPEVALSGGWRIAKWRPGHLVALERPRDLAALLAGALIVALVAGLLVLSHLTESGLTGWSVAALLVLLGTGALLVAHALGERLEFDWARGQVITRGALRVTLLAFADIEAIEASVAQNDDSDGPTSWSPSLALVARGARRLRVGLIKSSFDSAARARAALGDLPRALADALRVPLREIADGMPKV